MRKINVCVEGNVGSGKSTVVISLQKALSKILKGKIKIVLEPVEKWQLAKENGVSILELSYTNPMKYSLSFQVKALADMIKEHTDQNEDYEVCIFERKPLTSIEVFAENLRRKGFICNMEKSFLHDVLDTFQETGKQTKIDHTIYLKTTPTTALDRIRKRNRDEENKVELKEIEDLNEAYEKYMSSHKENVTTIQAEKPKEMVLEEAVKTILGIMENP